MTLSLGTLLPADVFAAVASDTTWLDERRKGIGASEAPRIMKGEWGALWQDKMGLVEHSDLSDELMAMFGKWAEPFNLAWFEKTTGHKIYRHPDTITSDEHPFMFVHLDAGCAAGAVEAKCYAPFTKDEEAVEKAYWQCVHNMAVTGESTCALSVMFGNLRHKVFWIERNENDIAKLIAKETEFWGYVTRNEPPPDLAAESVTVAFDTMRTVDMTKSKSGNEWAMLAADWLGNAAAAKKYDKAAEGLKKLVEADVKLASGNGIKITRAQNAALTIRFEKEEKEKK